mgnify:CR=1 FL=1
MSYEKDEDDEVDWCKRFTASFTRHAIGWRIDAVVHQSVPILTRHQSQSSLNHESRSSPNHERIDTIDEDWCGCLARIRTEFWWIFGLIIWRGLGRMFDECLDSLFGGDWASVWTHYLPRIGRGFGLIVWRGLTLSHIYLCQFTLFFLSLLCVRDLSNQWSNRCVVGPLGPKNNNFLRNDQGVNCRRVCIELSSNQLTRSYE